MTTLIKFPDKDERQLENIKKLLERVEYPNEEIEKCVKEMAMRTLPKYYEIPRGEMDLDIPPYVTKEDKDALSNQIRQWLMQYIIENQKSMIVELVRSQREICKLRHENYGNI